MHKLVTLINTNQVKPSIAPIGLDYLHGSLVRAGFEVELLDLCFSEDFEADIANYCSTRRPDFWGVTLRNSDDTYFASQHSFMTLVQRMVQVVKRHSDAPITMGGVGFSIMPKQILDYCQADFGIVCEGEVSFPLLLTRLAKGESYDDISGLVYRTADGFKQNPTSYADLSQVGAHSRNFIDNKKYFALGGQAGIETKRGCNRACIYCVEPRVKGSKVRLRDPAHVVDEMESLLDRGIYAFHVNDSEFNLDIDHARAFCDEIRRRNLHERVQWYAYGMPAPFPDRLARSMSEAGCAGMNFGVDSASEKMLRVLKRTFRPKHIAAAVETCKRYQLPYMIEILFGAPGETAETVKETIDFLRQIDAERVFITVGLRVFPDTELEEMVRGEGISPDNPNLYGVIKDNDKLIYPLFYLASQIAPNPPEYIGQLIGDDPRFFGVNTSNMNYNANQLLVEAIERGERGAYWAILADIGAKDPALMAHNSAIPVPLSVEQEEQELVQIGKKGSLNGTRV
jgi:radical SAM superfamily enzyme YgiQ (UPF0313 family)